MFQKKLRLKTKEVRFLTRKGIRYYGRYFSFHSFPQYPNILHNQISCHISIKYDKRAVHRNKLKKIIINYIQEEDITTKQRTVGGTGKTGYYKIFIGLNKQNIEHFKTKIKDLNKKEQRKTIQQFLAQHFVEREHKLLSFQSKTAHDKHSKNPHSYKKNIQRKD